MGTPYLRLRRGKHANVSPVAGDILLYQANGKQIRGLIREQVLELKTPVVLLGHSLGGVACVDLLMDPDEAELRTRVKMLATVGSQAPYFYEINALSSLEYGEKTELPTYFPWWLNIYDRGDFLSYVGTRLFPNRIEDREVRTHQPFPQSHSAYWSRKDTYEHLVKAIHEHALE
jgi:pimeloyl-ACP methyl ester carboxylesterase